MAKTWAIGDVHGFSLALCRILDRIEPQKDDTVVMLGDYIDRGPDSRGVIDRLLRLRSECRLVTLRGNHEAMLLELLEREQNGQTNDSFWKRIFGKKSSFLRSDWLDLGGRQTLASYGPLTTRISQLPEQHLQFLAETVLYHESPNANFTHAAYIPELEMSEQPIQALLYHRLRVSIPGPHFSGKTFYVGHSAQRSGNILDKGHIICIDTCLYGGGWLTAREIDSGEMIQLDAAGRLRS